MSSKKTITKKVKKQAKNDVKVKQSIVGSKVRFTAKDESVIRKNKKLPTAVLAELLGRTESSIRHKKLCMGIK